MINRLRERNNTIIIIEHNLDVIKTADWVVDMGPEGGDKGGNIIAIGTGFDRFSPKISKNPNIWLNSRSTAPAAAMLYKRYREILFQKVALCYVLHFVQDGSSKCALGTYVFAKKSTIGGKRVYISPITPDQPPL